MKPASLLSAFFAAFGLYLAIQSLAAVVGSFAILQTMAQFPDDSVNRWMIPLQLLPACLPLIAGVLLFVFARRLGLLAARASGIGGEIKWEVQPKPCDLLAVLLAVLGVYLLVTNIARGVQVAFLVLQMKAGSVDIAVPAARHFPGSSELVAIGVCMAGGIVLARYCAALSRWIMRKA
jgi:hypothetical protein